MSSPQHEPTMEEILASIRKIISDDAPAAGDSSDAHTAIEATALTPEPAPAETAPIDTPDIAILELTEEVVETPAPAAPTAPEPDRTADDIIFQAEEPAPAMQNDIFSDHTRKAMDDAFASISERPEKPAAAPAPAAPIAPVDGSSIETVFERAVRESFEPVLHKYLSDNSGAVIERMKPLIREWMDEHFPALLDGAVRAEVERVVTARGVRR